MLQIRSFTTAEAAPELLVEIRILLDDAFDGAFSNEDWDHALGGSHVIALDRGTVVGHAAVVARTIEVAGRPLRTGYVEGVATTRDRRREGVGAQVMTALAVLLRDDYELGALSTGSHPFYERLGWERWRGPTSVRHESSIVRTEEEDDGVMVLRFGPSADVDLNAPISCDVRSGDHW